MNTQKVRTGFNPRARVGRDAASEVLIVHGILFQSTRPRGARLERLFPALFHAGFNPRARVGRDKSISLTVRIFLCFNPRARVGRDAR